MKKTFTPRLKLDREMLRHLVAREISRVQGGVPTGCASMATQPVSGCSTGTEAKCVEFETHDCPAYSEYCVSVDC